MIYLYIRYVISNILKISNSQSGAHGTRSGMVHCASDVQNSDSIECDPTAGLYTVDLDDQGAQITNSVLCEKLMFSAPSYRGMSFDSKPWLVLIPNGTPRTTSIQ